MSDNLGVIINDREGMDKSNDRSDGFNLDEAVVPLRMPHTIFNKLLKAAEFNGLTLEKYCMYRLVQTLETKVGGATIDAPSAFSGAETQKITGPKGGIISRG